MGCASSVHDRFGGLEVEAVSSGSCTVFGNKWVVPDGQPAILSVRGRASIDGDAFAVTDLLTGKPLLKVQGDAKDATQRNICDADNGKPICQLPDALTDIDKALVPVKDCRNGDQLFQLQSTSWKQMATGLKATDGHNLQLEGDMDMSSKRGNIWIKHLDGRRTTVAQVLRATDLLEMSSPDDLGYSAYDRIQNASEDSYYLKVAPGVDVAVVLTMAIAAEGSALNWLAKLCSEE